MWKKLIYVCTAFGAVTPAMAADDLRVLYMGVDGAEKLLPRDHPAFVEVFDATGNYLHNKVARVFEAESRDPAGGYRMREALDDLQNVDPNEIDVAVTVSLKHLRQEGRAQDKDRLVAVARVVDPRDGRVIDTIRIKSPIAEVNPERCHHECRRRLMHRHVREILPEFKKDLAASLRNMPAREPVYSRWEEPVAEPGRYTLTLKGFSPREIRFIEDRIARLDSTRDFSSLRSNDKKRAFWLERKAGAGPVKADLADVLSTLDLQARFIKTDRQITLIKQGGNLAYLD